MTAKQQALQDIKNELRKEGKVFITFRSELNHVMRKLVSSQLKAQKTGFILNTWKVDDLQEE